ncbi:MAG: FHA domain-containing protein [Anaerolineales bacterium]|jgi:pSer/pThr/pTyr-binding forkhead associated (FHA) protein
MNIKSNAFIIINTQVIRITDTPLTIGRRFDNNLVVSVNTVSRHHAVIQREEGHYVIIDLNSTGGTFVNDKKVMKAVLKSGDSILLADTPLVFVENAPHLAKRASDTTGNIRKNRDKSTTRPTKRKNKLDWRPKE